MVSKSQPAARRSRIAAVTSWRSSPMPRIRLDLVIRPSALAAASTASERWYRKPGLRSEEHTSELQSPCNLVCRLLLEKKNIIMSLPFCETNKPKETNNNDLNRNL